MLYVYVANNPLKFIDPDGKQIGIPMNSPVGNPQQLQRAYMHQRYPEGGDSTWDAFTRGLKPFGGVTLSISGKVAAFFSVEGSVNMTVVTAGVDKGGTNFYATGSLGVEKDVSLSATASIEVVIPKKTSKFTGSDLEGKSTKQTFEIPLKKGLSVNFSKTYAKSDKTGTIDSYGIGTSIGVGVKNLFKGVGEFLNMFNVSYQENNTKGFNTNEEKK